MTKTNATTWPNILKKRIFKNLTARKGIKSIWNAIKSFLSNRGIIINFSITLEENWILEDDPKETTKVFSNYYINIVETTSGKRPSSISNPNSQCQDRATVKKSLNPTKIMP